MRSFMGGKAQFPGTARQGRCVTVGINRRVTFFLYFPDAPQPCNHFRAERLISTEKSGANLRRYMA